jgi:hypothetical protein
VAKPRVPSISHHSLSPRERGPFLLAFFFSLSFN